jgi:hypothetical protein
MSCSRKGTCGRGPEGSGYVKPNDPAKAEALEQAYQDALAARSIYDNFWIQPPPLDYNPDGSNAQQGWPSSPSYDVSSAHIGWQDRIERVRVANEKRYARWEDTAYDPVTEFTGVDIMGEERIVTVDYPQEGISGGEIKIHDETVAFDMCDVIELIP